MIAEAQQFVAHIGNIRRNVRRVGPSSGSAWKPSHTRIPYSVRKARHPHPRLAHPVANQVEIGPPVQIDLRVQPIARIRFMASSSSPIAATDKNRHAVDGNRQRVRAGNRIGKFADAKSTCVGSRSASLEDQMQPVKIRRAVAVGPPKPWTLHVQRGRVRGIECNELRAATPAPPADERRCSGSVLHHAVHRLVADIFHRRLHSQVRRIDLRQRQVGSYQPGPSTDHRPRSREIHLLPDARVAIAHRVESFPANRRQERSAVDGRDAAIWSYAVAQRASWRDRRCGCGATRTATTSQLHPRGNVEGSAQRTPRTVPTCAPFTHAAADSFIVNPAKHADSGTPAGIRMTVLYQ